jgi:predicted nucleotidyltransferase
VTDPLLEKDPVLAEIVRRLVDTFDPECIYLFGSTARGTPGPDSDYDLMVIVSSEAPEKQRRSRTAYEALWGTGASADVLVWTRDAFESRLHLRASLPSTVKREGRVLYAA